MTNLTPSKILHRLNDEGFDIVAWSEDDCSICHSVTNNKRMITFKQTILGDLDEKSGIRCLDIMPEGNRVFVGYASHTGRADNCLKDIVRFMRTQ